jgi:hypothetical protein
VNRPTQPGLVQPNDTERPHGRLRMVATAVGDIPVKKSFSDFIKLFGCTDVQNRDHILSTLIGLVVIPDANAVEMEKTHQINRRTSCELLDFELGIGTSR